MGVTCTAKDVVHIVNATENHGDGTILFCLIACTIYLLDISHVAAVVVGFITLFVRHRNRGPAAHVTQGVTAAEDIVQMTAHQFGNSLAATVFFGTIVK